MGGVAKIFFFIGNVSAGTVNRYASLKNGSYIWYVDRKSKVKGNFTFARRSCGMLVR